MAGRIRVIGKVRIGSSREKALAVLWDLSNLARYEPKVNSVRVRPEQEQEGTYCSRGLFAGLPWEALFSYRLKKNGFHSEMMCGPPGVEVSGGFVVSPGPSEGCFITHYETYRFPPWLAPMMPLVRLYLAGAMKRELRNLAKFIAAPFSSSLKLQRAIPISVGS